MNKPEILAPAGSFDAFMAAVYNGCDAVYLGGGEFGARAFADNFDIETLKEVVRIGRLYNVKIYYTINTLVKEKELKHLLDTVNELRTIGIDTFIVQDLGVIALLNEYFDDIELHASTQVNCHSLYGIHFLEHLGITRTVLARELLLDEIEYISNNHSMELEVFVHGALCYCSSGQCLMSSFLGGRSGNRGRCAQPCRLKYKTIIDDTIVDDSHILSPKDIQTLTILPDLIDVNIASFKIEGRMKSKEYVGLMTKLYRYYTDMYITKGTIDVTQADINAMNQIFNRGSFSTGYYQNYNGPSMITKELPKHQGLIIGKVDNTNGNKLQAVLFEDAANGDCLEFTLTDGSRHSFILQRAYKKGNVTIPLKRSVNALAGKDIRRIKSTVLNNNLNDYEKNAVKNYIHMHVEMHVDMPIRLTLSNGNRTIFVEGDIVQAAEKQGLSIERIEKQLLKIGDYPVMIEDLTIDKDEQVFMPVSQMNQLRRMGLEKWFHLDSSQKNAIEVNYKSVINNQTSLKINITVLLKNSEQLEAVLQYSIKRVYLEWFSFEHSGLIPQVKKVKEKGIEVYIAIPKLIRRTNMTMLHMMMDEVAGHVDGYLIRSIDAYEFVRAFDKNAVIQWDYGMNIYNNASWSYLKSMEASSGYCPSPELNKRELSSLELNSAEFVAYGHIRTMTTVQCIRKNTSECVKEPGKVLYLEDRKGIRIPVETVCQLCYNNLYNGIPMYMIDKLEELSKIGFSNYRIDLLHEDTATIDALMSNITSGISDKSKPWSLPFTRGHYNKGVE